ncbi:MAG: dihydrofolate reductase, partial [Rhodoferax sp.]|nr:dihydrofolate reductase [Rhodoferax sp.]
MKLHLILARSANGVIGKDGKMPWHLPEDLANFKKVTLGKPVIMGRKTWDSLPEKVRPLPERLNIVITRQKDWQAPGAKTANSLFDAMGMCPLDGNAWVMGGAEIYKLAMPLAVTAVITEIEAEFEGDTLAPKFGPSWKEVSRESHTSASGLKFSFVTY